MDIVKPNTGDCLLVSHIKDQNFSDNILPDLIQYFEKCIWNHAGMFIWINGVLYVAEMIEQGFCLTNFIDYKQKTDVRLLGLRPKFNFDVKTMEGDIFESLGRERYAFFELLSQAIYLKTGKWIDLRGKNRFICYQKVAYLYEKSNPADGYKDLRFDHFQIKF